MLKLQNCFDPLLILLLLFGGEVQLEAHLIKGICLGLEELIPT